MSNMYRFCFVHCAFGTGSVLLTAHLGPVLFCAQEWYFFAQQTLKISRKEPPPNKVPVLLL